MTLDVGTQIGDYLILSRIGEGPDGIVFEAEHEITKRVDALKVMPERAAPGEDREDPLLHARSLAKLHHPNIAQLYQVFQAPCGPVLAMELVQGESLRTVLDRGGLPLATGLRYIMDALVGLDYAAQAGVIHADLNPDHIMITPEGTVKITGFKLGQAARPARLSDAGDSGNVPWYVAPEQVDGKDTVDARVDIYSCGAVLYEVATGRLPYPGTKAFSVMRAILEKEPAPPVQLNPEIGKRLSDVILRAMEKAPSRRFPTAAAFRAALRATAPAAAVQPLVVAPPRSAFPWRLVAPLVTVGAGVALAFMAGTLWKSRTSPAAPPAVEVSKDANSAQPAGNPETAESSAKDQARPKRAQKGSAARTTSSRRSLPFANVEGRYVIGQNGETNAPAQPAAAPPAANPTPAEPVPAKAAAEAPQAAPAEAPPTEEPKKKPGVVRALGRLFHKKDKNPKAKSEVDDSKPELQKPGTGAAGIKM